MVYQHGRNSRLRVHKGGVRLEYTYSDTEYSITCMANRSITVKYMACCKWWADEERRSGIHNYTGRVEVVRRSQSRRCPTVAGRLKRHSSVAATMRTASVTQPVVPRISRASFRSWSTNGRAACLHLPTSCQCCRNVRISDEASLC